MFFKIKYNHESSLEQFRSDTLLSAYFIISKYPLKASELILDAYIQQQYDTSLKDLCVKLLLNLTFHADNTGNLVLLFKDPKYDLLASLITYGTGAIPGSRILQTALK